MRSIAIPKNILQHDQTTEVLQQKITIIRSGIQSFYKAVPDVSIIIPAYNEENSILKTLSSFSVSMTKKTFEIIVVNNNSTDATGKLAGDAGTTCIIETSQGITAARNAGLWQAKGMFVLNADADTIYPPDWIDLMLSPLMNDNVILTYGNFSFIPTAHTPRLVYSCYEYISDLSKWINKKFKEEAVNVYGFNSAFRRLQGLEVGGFDHPPGTNEDGWMALKLRNHFKKHLYNVKDRNATVWTSDRRIQSDGGLYKAVVKRLKRHIFNLSPK